MASGIQLSGFLFLTGALACTADLGVEPICSRFDYDERLLAKTMRLENSMEDIMNRVAKIEAAQEEAKENKAHQKKCPTSFMYNSELNLCWRLEKNRKQNWFDADKSCSEEGAHLMILNDIDTISFIQEYLRAADADIVFVGASDILKEGSFKWLDGKSVQNIPWGNNQPNGERNQNCLVSEKVINYLFHDHECSRKFSFLCQII